MDAIRLIRIAISVVSERLITILALTMCCGLSCWVMWQPQWDRVVTLGIFTVFSYCVIRNMEPKKYEDPQA